MDAKLVVAKGKTTLKEIPLAGLNTIIGRKNDCGLRIPSPLVSRQHCELTCARDRLVVKDLGSSNGTFVNGSKIKQKELKSGDTLGVGPVIFIVQLEGEPISPSDTARPRVARPAAAQVVSDDAADFVVGDEAASDGAADLFASEDVANGAVVADETHAAEAADFVVAEADSDEGDTVHDVNVAEFVGADAEPGAAEVVAEAELAAEPEPEVERVPAKKKGGLFSRLFKKRERPLKAEPPASELPKKQTKTKPPATAKSPGALPKVAEPAKPDFVVADDATPAAGVNIVGEDDMADFLMKLNEKEQ